MICPISFRQHVLAVKEREGLTFAETAERFAVGIASLVRWNKEIKPKVYRREKGLKIDLEKLAQDVCDQPDGYQYERAARFGVTPKAIWQALRKLGVTYKKRCAIPRRTPPHSSAFARKLSNMKRMSAPSSISTRAALPMICLEPTAMRPRVSDVSPVTTGTPKAGSMSLAHSWLE